jgi:hypothetical protein
MDGRNTWFQSELRFVQVLPMVSEGSSLTIEPIGSHMHERKDLAKKLRRVSHASTFQLISGFRRGVNEVFTFWGVTQCRLVTDVSGQPLGPILRVNMGPTCTKTLVSNYQSALRNIREERRSYFLADTTHRLFILS